ncbi:hypothetical protein ACHAXA_010696 [Cyclostephanos tholiformis]|uniref:Methyltransferase type 11 domain-containing protein n=1 Tax=Cyclostephanos tholiformis TaxID=382380 RepID=A0ABD3SF44_9STRA
MMLPMPRLLLHAIALASSSSGAIVVAFSPPPHASIAAAITTTRRTATNLGAASSSSSSSSYVDPLTYLRTEWVSASLVSNQIPKEADKVLQLGTEDGRLVNFVPRTVREIITSSAEPKDDGTDGGGGGGLTVSCERQLRQMSERRRSGAVIVYSNQPADNLKETPSSSVDIVVSLLAARRMNDNGLDWKRAIREAGRVLKPGGRFLFVEGATVDGESYLDYVVGLSERGGVEIKGGLEKLATGDDDGGEDAGSDDNDALDEGEVSPLFEEVGYDMVDMVLQPHVAGVAIKADDADLTPAEKERTKAQVENDRLADLSLSAYERGIKKRKRKKEPKAVGTRGV